MLIKAVDLRRRYPKASRDAVSGISLTILPGEVVAVVGHNGAGKSTLFDLVGGLLKPDSGTVVSSLRSGQIGWCPQREIIDWSLTVRQNVSMGLELRLGRRVDRSTIEDTLDIMGLQTFADRQAETLSGGELRRTQIARALAGAPRLAILDEPTTGLDPEGVHRVFEHVRQRAAAGSAALISSHETSRIAPFCTRVIALKDGKKIADASTEDFMTGLEGQEDLWLGYERAVRNLQVAHTS